MQQQVEMQFQWKRHETKEVIVAVTKAVILGYNAIDKLLAMLPMFSTYRIALAIDALITADMAENNFGVLCIHPDMQIVFELLKRMFTLRMSEEQAKSPAVRRYMIIQVGSSNSAGVETLLRVIPVPVEA